MVALAPRQMIPSLLVVPDVSTTVVAGVGSGFTVIVVVDTAVQPAALVTVTVYVVVPPGVTEIEAVFAPVLQE
jgi:hypothetical protein